MSVSVLSIFGQPYEAVSDSYGEPLDTGDLNPIIDRINDEVSIDRRIVLSEREAERDGFTVTAFDIDFAQAPDELDIMRGIEEEKIERLLVAELAEDGVEFDRPTLETHRLISVIESGDDEEY